MRKYFKKSLFFIVFFLAISLPNFAFSDVFGQKVIFFTDPNYDLSQRERINATLRHISTRAYFYLEDEWWNSLSSQEKREIQKAITDLGKEFDTKIYPILTSTFGSEWKPGIDKDDRITIFLHRMKERVGGYFSNGNEYYRFQNPRSNEREMIYLNAKHLNTPLIKSYLSHEFTHLIEFNQKERIRETEDEIWLSEARAEISPTILGYDDSDYKNSYLFQRVKQFLNSPSDSLIEWKNKEADYGMVNIFFQYLLDHYGLEILIDSLLSEKKGIDSINEALKRNNYQKNFSQIFTDWTVAVFLGDCKKNKYFCYKNKNLKNLKITPSLIFLPLTQKSSVSLTYNIKEWSGNWYRIIGGEGDLKVIFDGEENADFKVIYIPCQNSDFCQVYDLKLNKKNEGRIFLENFRKNWSSLNLIVSIQPKAPKINFSSYSFSLFLDIEKKNKEPEKSENEKLIEELKKKIIQLQQEIDKLKDQLLSLLKKRFLKEIPPNFTFKRNFRFGMISKEIKYLQLFLNLDPETQLAKNGPGSPGKETEYFGPLTKSALIKFQEKYKDEILKPLGLKKGTGFFGPKTRTKINKLLRDLAKF